MEAGQKFYVAMAGLEYTRAYSHVAEYESIGSVAGVVAFRRFGGEVDSYPAADCYATKEEATAACVSKLRERRDRINESIEAEVARLEGQS